MQKKCADYANVGAGLSDKMHPATELEETASSPWLQLDCGGTDVYANICRSARLNKNISMRDIEWPNQIDESSTVQVVQVIQHLELKGFGV